MTWGAVWTFFAAVHPSVWVATVGLAGTIAGIMLTNRGNTRREETKRLFESRRDVFLDATEALATGPICIGQLNDLARPTSDILRPFLDGLGSVFKVHLLASRNTSELVVDLVQQLSQSIVELTLARIPLNVERQRLDNMDQNAPDHQKLKSQGETILFSSVLLYSDQCTTAICAIAPQIGRIVCAIRADLAVASYPPGYQLPFTKAALAGKRHLREEMDRFTSSLGLPTPPWPPMPPAPPAARQGTPAADTPPPRR